MGQAPGYIIKLFELAQRCYADARVCTDAATKRKLVAMGDDYVRQAKKLQYKTTPAVSQKIE